MSQLQSVLNGNGFLDRFYTLLWYRNETKKSQDIQSFTFMIPHTIIIRNSKPVTWFFSNQNNIILKKKVQNTNIQSILQYFQSSQKSFNKTDIAGQYMYEKYSEEDQQEQGETGKMYIEYISFDKLEEFLLKEKHPQDGVFQQFIPPRGDYNSVMECVWSPNVMMVEKRTNRSNIYDKRREIFERCVTFEGDDIFSNIEYVKGMGLSMKLRKSVDDIVNHVMTLSYEKYLMKRMVAYFKIDKDENLYFLFCNSSRSSTEKDMLKRTDKEKFDYLEEHGYQNTPLNILRPNIDDKAKRIFTQQQTRPAEILKQRDCIRCKNNYTQNEMIDVPLKFLCQEFNQKKAKIISLKTRQKLQKPNQTSEFTMFKSLKIPPEIHKLYPKMNEESYLYWEKQPKFQYETIELCQDCYLDLVKTQAAAAGIEDIEYVQQNEPETGSYTSKFVHSKLFQTTELLLKNKAMVYQQVKQLYPKYYRAAYSAGCSKKISHNYSNQLYKELQTQQRQKIYDKSQKKQLNDLLQTNQPIPKQNFISKNHIKSLSSYSFQDKLNKQAQKLQNIEKQKLQQSDNFYRFNSSDGFSNFNYNKSFSHLQTINSQNQLKTFTQTSQQQQEFVKFQQQQNNNNNEDPLQQQSHSQFDEQFTHTSTRCFTSQQQSRQFDKHSSNSQRRLKYVNKNNNTSNKKNNKFPSYDQNAFSMIMSPLSQSSKKLDTNNFFQNNNNKNSNTSEKKPKIKIKKQNTSEQIIIQKYCDLSEQQQQNNNTENPTQQQQVQSSNSLQQNEEKAKYLFAKKDYSSNNGTGSSQRTANQSVYQNSQNQSDLQNQQQNSSQKHSSILSNSGRKQQLQQQQQYDAKQTIQQAQQKIIQEEEENNNNINIKSIKNKENSSSINNLKSENFKNSREIAAILKIQEQNDKQTNILLGKKNSQKNVTNDDNNNNNVSSKQKLQKIPKINSCSDIFSLYNVKRITNSRQFESLLNLQKRK